ncbi:MAG: DNA-processing protein DprA [Clostridia bacterium]|nr:DNA-processing protein DprA [Clostridia bacterium]
MAENIKHWVWLSSIPQIGAVKSRKLLEHFGDPKCIWEADILDLKGLDFLTAANVNSIRNVKYREEAEKHFENIYKYGIKVIPITDKAYPEYLRNIYDPPVVLYSRGKLGKDEKRLAVVGSRKATTYGLNIAKTISHDLAQMGIAIVSGMARGVDSFAHKGALDAKGRTIAVLGCGLDTVYPRENKELMENIEVSGATISEYIPGVKPMPQNFPARNRIISGLSLGVIVIEAGDKSGSLITADFALEQGREVFAVPGNLDSMNSKGTNRLIKEGAKMITGVDDILEELKMNFESEEIQKQEFSVPVKKPFYHDLDQDEIKLVENLQPQPLHIDALASKCCFSIQATHSIITMLELKGIVEQDPGKIFRLK